jgi:ubiquinone/menaquinone biosynthesis C-methylase UbiE
MNRFHRWYCGTGHWRHSLQDDTIPWVIGDLDLGSRVLEIGPGPGLATEVLAASVDDLVAVELDERLANKLRTKMSGSKVRVVNADASRMSFDDDEFSAVVCFTMLHHVPSIPLQDRIFTQAFRVLQPGGVFAGSDSLSGPVFRAAHLFDTMVFVDPVHLQARLERVGFGRVCVEAGQDAFRFEGWKPPV